MTNDNDELAKIRQRKMKEMLNQNKTPPPIKIEKLNEVVRLTDAEFVEFVKNEELPIIVDFWAPWCMPCRMAAQYFPVLAQKFAGKMRFAKINVDENSNIAGAFRVTSIPYFLVFYKGQLATRFVGALPQKKMEAVINEILDKLKAL